MLNETIGWTNKIESMTEVVQNSVYIITLNTKLQIYLVLR